MVVPLRFSFETLNFDVDVRNEVGYEEEEQV